MPTDYHAKHRANELREIDARLDDLIQCSQRQLHREHSVEPLFVLGWELR